MTTTDVRNQYKGKVVAVGGPPHSGKSVFLAELYRQLLAKRPSEVFLQRACPDGEGMWSAESDPTIVAEIRRKGNFSQEFMIFTLKAIENLGKHFPIVLLDLGGKRTAENAEILKRSTHLIILSSLEKEIQAWQDFANAEGCKTIATFRSQLVQNISARSHIDISQVPVQGKMINLDRNADPDGYRESVNQFAEWLTQS